MILIADYINEFSVSFPTAGEMLPWHFTSQLPELLSSLIELLKDEFIIENNIAVHRSAIIEEGVVIKGPAIIHANCFVGAHAYLRGGVFLNNSVSIGPCVEIKTSYIGSNSSVAHFNFIGDSLLGSNVNFEAGSVIANHYNERKEKLISVRINGNDFETGTMKFGALVGDHSKVGANAVLSPGTILPPASIVKRLALVEQQR